MYVRPVPDGSLKKDGGIGEYLNILPQHDVCVNHIERCLFVSAVRMKHSVSDAKVAKPENGLIQARGRLPQFKNLKIVVDLHVYL